MKHLVQRVAIGSGIHTAEWLVSTRAGQQLLKESHGTDRRPRCMCKPGGVEMYVGRRGQIYYLSRMPGSGFLHADNCASVEDSTLLSGALSYAPGAIVEGADGTLQLAANLDRRERQAAPITEVSIDGVLEVLIEQADLNRVQTGEEPRTWSRVREKLISASQSICFGAVPLSTSLLLPDRYVRERSADALAACEAKISTTQGGALILAPLKELRLTTYSWQVVLKHLPGLRLWASKDAAEQMEARWAAHYFNSNPEYALCLVVAKPARREGNYTVTNMAVLPTDANYFPCRSHREAEVAAELIAEGRPLLRPLRFDSYPDHVLADFAILEGENPTPVFVLAPTGAEEFDAAKRSVASMMERNKALVKVYPA
ncbi:MAG: hypothetical protein FD131_3340 [Rhodocyclaceae bacterium]|nr:MAG: hypothetical protein FD131_3340 [Rhodocyclaceae bacterium]